ncbi:MAG: efflux RND transporter periplasmic adaptor subunit [Thermoanaerobaculia bacterium]|nr:efflux RND transporter periplasmic adaptor subunit [Thermoanaerobaculia bacterium]
MNHRHKWIPLAVGVAIVSLLALGAMALQNRLAAERAGEWVEATSRDLVLGIEVTGVLESTSSEQFGPPQLMRYWNFKVSMMAPEGSDVRKGQPLLGFDTTELRDRLQTLKAEADSAGKQIEKTRADLVLRREDNELALAEAEARLRKAEMKLEAPEELMGANERREIVLGHELAQKEVEYRKRKNESLERAAEAEIRALETKRDRALERVRELEENIGQMMIPAPRAGTVVYVTDRRDQKKKVGDTVWRMEKVIELPDLTSMRAIGEIDEADSGKVEIGQKVTIVLDAHPDDEFEATITEIGNTVRESETSQLKVLPVVLELERTDTEKMRPGMRFRGTIEMDTIESTLVVPLDAVRFDAEGAYVIRRGVLSSEKARVDLGRRSSDSVEIISGLSPGDRVLVRDAGTEEAS